MTTDKFLIRLCLSKLRSGKYEYISEMVDEITVRMKNRFVAGYIRGRISSVDSDMYEEMIEEFLYDAPDSFWDCK